MNKTVTLRYNDEADCYEGFLRVRVSPELFSRLLLQEIQQTTRSDLTNPQTWTRAVEKVGNVTRWLDKPTVEISPVDPEAMLAHTISVVERKPVGTPQTSPKITKVGTSYAEIEARMRERAKAIPPYLWMEQARTPIYSGAWDAKKYRLITDSPEYKRVSYIRSDEAKILKHLLQEWQSGIFDLTEEAEHLQLDQERSLGEKTTQMIQAVAQAVNGARLL